MVDRSGFLVGVAGNRYVLYGLDHHKEVIDTIIRDIKAKEHYFDIRLILSEALNNAFCHGNKYDKSKPIFLSYRSDSQKVRFEVEDCGVGFDSAGEGGEMSDESLLQENGRGLFLIRGYSDYVKVEGNRLIMEKLLK
jgi:serine/threonine-protein kinase RsbW